MEEEKSASGNGASLDSKTMNVLGRMVGKERSLVMNQVPVETKREFVSFANEGFMGNYGFALKWLVDLYTGSLPSKNGVTQAVLEDHEVRLQKLESQKERGNVIRTLSGKTIVEVKRNGT